MIKQKGKVYLELRNDRILWLEDYIGGEPYKGDGPQYWKPTNFGWKFIRGEGYGMTKEWFRVLIGQGYIHFRFAPFIFVIFFYNRTFMLRLRWN